MYKFVSHTFNCVKGACPCDCAYCYMKRWGTLKEVRFDEKELRTDLGSGNFIFVGSSCDMFAHEIPYMWIFETLRHCKSFPDNRYLFQSKNPFRMVEFMGILEEINPVICTTIETNRFYPEVMRNAPSIESRVAGMKQLSQFERFVTIEPILDFDLDDMVEMIKDIAPTQVNIGADSGKNNLPEPSYDKILSLSEKLSKFTKIENKRNLGRLKNDKNNV